MRDDMMKKLVAMLDEPEAAKVPTDRRMVWDGQQMHGGPDVESAAERALLDSIAYGCGMWKQGFDRAVYIGARTIYKPQTPAEVDAFVERLIADDFETRWRGTWRLSRLSTALLAAYP